MPLSFSIIIPAYQAPQEVKALIRALQRQSALPNEILVIDSSPQEIISSALKNSGVRIIRVLPEEFNHGLSRTLAAQKARGEILVFFTQDALPAHKDSLERLLTAFEQPSVAAAFGRQISPPQKGLLAQLHRLYNYPPRSRCVSWEDRHRLGIRTVFFSNSFAAYRRDRLEEIGWFPSVPALEDVYAAVSLLKAGYQLAYVSEAKVWHGHCLSLREEFHRYRRVGAFYHQNKWILEECGRLEGEGRRYFLFIWKELSRRKKRYLFPYFICQQIARLSGYLLGLYLGY